MKKAHQRLYFLRRLKEFRLSSNIMSLFYRAAIESILTFAITVWGNSADQKDLALLQRIANSASRITGSDMPSITSLYESRALRKCRAIYKDTEHPVNHLFATMRSGIRFRALPCRTARMRRSFYVDSVLRFNNVSDLE